MRRALDLATRAAEEGEVPVGAVVTLNGEILAEARNAMRGQLDPTAHAEMMAIRDAAARLGSPRLDGCELWATLEPCPMCAAAISFARLRRLYYGASDPKGGGVEHGARVFSHPTCHHAPELYTCIEEQRAAGILRAFFGAKR